MGRVNKPLSAAEKRQMKQLLEDIRKRMIEEKKSTRGVTQRVVAEGDVLRKAEAIVRKMQYVTPYVLANKMEVGIGLAKRILRDLETKGVVKLYSKNRRVQVYVPAESFDKLVKPGAYSYTVEEM
ncbi:30S ribosomal protein S25 [Ignicoccus islandicus DSM 13165]|uniref:30S ribosomal protein S25 n=1 Tax=Ignicoccus islandicus DSM 13165 TaxID=940295 RepID=A0A0U2U6V5_9CREN|nr:hypothetical protein [Ignicoccus islandicus]ALU11876.1 30S ribosomal protein S25 [Ignicoccus islandicus DSM 13165]